jgi:hypothetical protein
VSQYPNPYNAPQPPVGYGGGSPYGYGDPSVQALAPCRRAGVLMVVYGVLIILGGAALMALSVMAPDHVIEQVIQQQRATMNSSIELTVELVRSVYMGMGVVIAALGVLYLILAVFVRRGGRGATVTGIVFTILVTLFTGCNAFAALGHGAEGLLSLIPLALTVWLLIWLFQANSAAGQWQNWKNQYAGQYYQYQQQQQMQGQYPPPYQQPPAQQPQYWQPQQPPQQPPPPQNWGPPPSAP